MNRKVFLHVTKRLARFFLGKSWYRISKKNSQLEEQQYLKKYFNKKMYILLQGMIFVPESLRKLKIFGPEAFQNIIKIRDFLPNVLEKSTIFLPFFIFYLIFFASISKDVIPLQFFFIKNN